MIDSIRKSGFQLSDIKYILLSHGHLDHFGGVARIQQLSGARVAALEEDWALMERAAKAAGPQQLRAAADPEARHGREGRRHADARRHDA